jgi:hypothetical protein|tara:strand:- start:189 stop:590 length:402 start_codon:yes stop_codon:yes gene_type:complete
MSTKFEKNMEDIFELPEKIEQTKELKPVDNSDETVDNDFKYARENLYNIIERGSDALNTLVDVANQSQHPRAFEVVGQLVKTLSDTNKDLLELQKKVKVIKKDIPDQPQNVTNALFVGNTSELQKMINKRNNE